MLGERGERRVGDGPDAHLQGCAVGDHRGDAAADGARLLPEGRVGGGRRERLAHLDREVDVVERDARVTVGVGHAVVDHRDDEAAALAAGLDGAGQEVDLEAEGEVPLARGSAVHEDAVDREPVAVEDRDEGEAARHVPQPGAAPLPGPDEARLERHARAVGEAGRAVEHVERVGLEGRVEQVHERPRDAVVAGDDDPRVVGQGGQGAGEGLGGDGLHVLILS
ncbi:hypothetical protein [Janibacter terrae]|uniref:hypothetical protein n=1 Tax=Janibacter terrae TaxID=103817 RepID=UPI0020D15092|nr:hypothetical protein [Janibacter terrae]